jgi:hypothetical protein
MNRQSTPAMARSMMLGTLILACLLAAPIVFMTGLVGGMPDRFATPLLEQWSLLKVLWASNRDAAIQILMQQPLVTIAHDDPVSGLAAWRLFLYPVFLALYLAISVFAAVILSGGALGTGRRRLVWLLPGLALVVFVTTYVQVLTCCTGGPRWAFEVGLFSLAYNAPGLSIDWQKIYAATEGIFSTLQIALALLGAALLAAAAAKRYKT